jgi:hypothetical protein
VLKDKVLNLWKRNLGTISEEIWYDAEITVVIVAAGYVTWKCRANAYAQTANGR